MSTPHKQAPANREDRATASQPAQMAEARPASAQKTPARQTTQAERAVMHPDHHDPDWRYYHAAVVS